MSTDLTLDEFEPVSSSYVADKLGLHRNTVQNMAARGEIPGALRVGRDWRFHRPWLNHWFSERLVKMKKPQTADAPDLLGYGKASWEVE